MPGSTEVGRIFAAALRFYTGVTGADSILTMKAWAIEHYGNNSVLKMMTIPTPTIGDDEILIKVEAASINPVDFKIRSGELKFILSYKFPLILGNDCAGIVTAVGARISKLKVGDKVYTRPQKDRIGTLAEFVACKEDVVAPMPKNLTYEEAASIPLVGLTSWQALIERSNIKSKQRVFIAAGSGGVGSFAIQLAKSYGAYVITTTSTKNRDFVKSLGADEVIDYKKDDLSKVTSNIDIFFDTIGGDTQRKAFDVVKPGGIIVSIVGPPTAQFARELGLNPFMQMVSYALSFRTNRRARRKGIHYNFLFMQPDGNALRQITELIEKNSIRPVIDKVYPFEAANEAMAYVESGHARGKVIVSMREQ